VFFRGGLPWLLLMENRPGGLAKGNAGHFAGNPVDLDRLSALHDHEP
jgi:hypothetical protein